jgi:uncharacterized protein YprB with RNaseH-like and TPR domain
MPSWEEIANEVVPVEANPGGLATGARRGKASGWQVPPARTDKELKFLPPPQCGPNDDFDKVMCGQEKTVPRHGTHYEIVRSARSYDSPFGDLAARLDAALENSKIEQLAGAKARDLIVMDIETSGVSDATPLFLIGTLRFDESEPQMEFFLARDSDEEAAALAGYHARARGKRLVTFNGKSFDWPFIQRRSYKHRVPYPNPIFHIDMLHHARRLWRRGLPDCRLQTLEKFLCGRDRIGDVPGWKIPGQYLDFVERRRAGQSAAWLLAPILHHNALDLLTLAEVVCLAHEL